jgi:signal transduction histidine kinase
MAEESRRSFMRLMSHELRTPLNSIIGFSEIIARELYGPAGDARYVEHANLIRQSGEKLLSLVSQIMEIARLEAGTGDDLHVAPEPAGDAPHDAVHALNDFAREHGVHVEVRLPTPEPVVVADGRGLKTVLFNLLHNAISFSPPGGTVVLEVSMDTGRVIYRVTDQGAGVPADQLSRLMRPFEQGENALVRRSTGAGLGLTMARLLCESMEGTLSLASPPGEGVTATVRLPRLPPRPVAV